MHAPRTTGSPPRPTRRDVQEGSVFGARDDHSGVKDPVKQYLDSIGRYPRLTREEEAELSKRALAGDEEAREWLVKCNLRLVVRICKDFTRNHFSLLELVSPGNEGLIVAARKYDATKGVPFGNYASIWIKQRVMKYAAEHGFKVRVPPYRAAIVNQVVRVHGKLMQTVGREPTAEEVAEHVSCTLDEVREVLTLLQAPLELDRPLKDENDAATFGAYFGESSQEAEERLDSDLHKIDMERAVKKVLSLLPERDAQVLVWNFGLNRQRPLDLEQIAMRLGVTRERARQIRNSALKKLAGQGDLLKYLT